MIGICLLSHLPVRSEASHRAEMATQLLFGETYEVILENKGWFQIRLHFDHYEGWIAAPDFTAYNEPENIPTRPIVSNAVSWITLESTGIKFPVVSGSSLPDLRNDIFTLNGLRYKFEGASLVPALPVNPEKITSAALRYLNAPYLWGGRSIFGIDCSGFVQMVFKLNGIILLRDAAQQAGQGTDVSFIEESQVGDLCFCENAEGKITHVGIYLGDGKIIHASGRVKIDTVDHFGIYNSDIQSYSHRLRLIRRFF